MSLAGAAHIAAINAKSRRLVSEGWGAPLASADQIGTDAHEHATPVYRDECLCDIDQYNGRLRAKPLPS